MRDGKSKPHSPPGTHRGSYPPREIQRRRNQTAFEDDLLFQKIKELTISRDKDPEKKEESNNESGTKEKSNNHLER